MKTSNKIRSLVQLSYSGALIQAAATLPCAAYYYFISIFDYFSPRYYTFTISYFESRGGGESTTAVIMGHILLLY